MRNKFATAAISITTGPLTPSVSSAVNASPMSVKLVWVTASELSTVYVPLIVYVWPFTLQV